MKPTLLIALLISMAGAAVVPQAGLRFYYSFDQQTVSGSKIKDLSGNGYDLTSSGPMKFSTDRFFNAGGALKMDGTYHLSALLPDSTVHAMTDQNDFTFGIAFNTTAPSTSMSGRMDIAGLGDPYNSGVFLSLHDNRLRIFLGNHGYYDTPDTLNDGKWHIAIAVRSQGAVFLFIDGKLSDQGAVTGEVYPGTDSLMIGKHGIKDESFYIGLLDDVFYYTRALSADDASTLYRLLSGAFVSFTTRIDTFTVAQPTIAWHAVPNAIAYAFEIGTDTLFTNPFVSIPLDDTTLTVPQAVAAGKYYLRVGCNYDDRSPFVFPDFHAIVVK
jgi:Concanavalin A-like lectin/glucanases superfamily